MARGTMGLESGRQQLLGLGNVRKQEVWYVAIRHLCVALGGTSPPQATPTRKRRLLDPRKPLVFLGCVGGRVRPATQAGLFPGPTSLSEEKNQVFGRRKKPAGIRDGGEHTGFVLPAAPLTHGQDFLVS